MGNANFLLLFLIFVTTPAVSQIQFDPYQSFATGSWADIVAVGDVNNDGLNDAVIGTGYYFDAANDYKIFVFLQNASGGLNPSVMYSYPPVYPGLQGMTVADLNNDGLNDIVVNYGTGIGILYQNTSATFNPIVALAPVGPLRTVKCGDLNNDGLTDIAMFSISGSVNQIKVLYQGAAGTFSESNYSVLSTVKEITIKDVNGDSKNDLLALSPSIIFVFTQNNSGGFNTYSTISNPQSGGMDAGDLNNDGKNDIAFSRGGNTPASMLEIMMQNPATGMLGSPLVLPAYDIPEVVEIADFNNDGRNEIAVLHGGWVKLSVYEQNASNIYDNYTMFDIPYSSHYDNQGLALGDLNNDGATDVAIADYGEGLVVLYNSSALGTDDFDSDTDSMLLFPNPADNYVTLRIPDPQSQNLSTAIYDMLGKEVLNGTYTIEAANEVRLDISQLEAGMYFVKVSDATRTFYRRLLKK